MSDDAAASDARSGAAAAADALRRHGVDVVFCLPGEETIALLEAIDAVGIELVVARHEQHAAFLAATHGRLTHRPGVLVTTLGPGMTNALTGLAHATLGGFPVVHVAGQKPLRDNDEGSFQVLDLVALAAPVTKDAVRCTDPSTVETTIAAALDAAVAGRPGAVFVELPQDVALDDAGRSDRTVERAAASGPVAAPAAIEAAARLLDGARRPAVIVASGAQRLDAAAALRSFAASAHLPVVPLQTGIGTIPPDHPSAMPALGMHRPDAAHLPLVDADLVIAIGYHPTEHPPLAWNRSGAPVVHVAAWPAPERRGYRPSVQLVGDVAASLQALATHGVVAADDRRDVLRAAIDAQLAAEPVETDGARISTHHVVAAVRAVLADDDVVALDNGSYKLWFARHYRTPRINGLLLDNALATMGAGLAAATEAARLEPEISVIAVVGDGGFMMNVGDVETAVRLGLTNLTVIVLRDDTYGFIAEHQRDRGRGRVAVDVTNPDFVRLAEAFGAAGFDVGGPDDLRSVIQDAVDHRGVSIVSCPLDERADDLLHRSDSLDGAIRRRSGADG